MSNQKLLPTEFSTLGLRKVSKYQDSQENTRQKSVFSIVSVSHFPVFSEVNISKEETRSKFYLLCTLSHFVKSPSKIARIFNLTESILSLQNELEEVTERLSGLVARPYLRTPRAAIVQTASLARQKRHEFTRAVSKGLIPPDISPPATHKRRKHRLVTVSSGLNVVSSLCLIFCSHLFCNCKVQFSTELTRMDKAECCGVRE